VSAALGEHRIALRRAFRHARRAARLELVQPSGFQHEHARRGGECAAIPTGDHDREPARGERA
jgi:hypothetical protein